MIDYSSIDNPVGQNWYTLDPDLRDRIERLVAREDREWLEPHLIRVGVLAGGPLAERAEIVDRNPPRLERYDRWGNEVCRVVHHPAAIAMKKDLWESGVSGPLLYKEAQRRGRRLAAVVQTAMSYLLAQADTGMLCATGMTGGVIGLVRRFAPARVRDRLLLRLTADRFEDSWDGAMFLTEKTGGSDLGTLTTRARAAGESWRLDGSKWFCSNVDAAAIATLARPDGAPEGIRGVALFVVPRVREDGSPNGIRIRRLKEKLGTRSVPTGEVDFVDAEAYLLAGEERAAGATDGRGINRMMGMVNDSRRGVAVMGLGIMRRAFLEAATFAAHRQAFGRRLVDQPLARETLLRMLVDLEAAAALLFETVVAEDRCGGALARLLVPLAKIRATRSGIGHASLALEMHGGNGYIEDWPTAKLFRDAQCHTIWEGTENILCLDVLRALRSEGVAKAVLERFASPAAPPSLENEAKLRAAEIRETLSALGRRQRESAEYRARYETERLIDSIALLLLCEEAVWEAEHRRSGRKRVIAELFAEIIAKGPPERLEQAARSRFEALVGYQGLAKE